MEDARTIGDVLEVVAVIGVFIVVTAGISALVVFRSRRRRMFNRFPGSGDM